MICESMVANIGEYDMTNRYGKREIMVTNKGHEYVTKPSTLHIAFSIDDVTAEGSTEPPL